MTGSELLMTGWGWEPSVVAGCAALIVGYFALVRRRTHARALYFVGGVLLLLLDLVSPIDLLGDQYLFSAHIVQHFLLALVIPPLLLLGVPRWLAQTALRRPVLDRFEREIAGPPVSWLLGVGAMVAWHAPVLFNAALASEGLHIFQHMSFLVTGMLFWWPVIGPLEERRLSAFAAISYLFSACVCCSLLGAVLAFAQPGLYPAYLYPDDRLGILPLLRESWGLDPKNDQQLGGMLMWVPGCFVYLSGILASVARWYSRPDDDEAAVTR
jgi:putative membrane protein